MIDFKGRLARLRSSFAQKEIDAVFISQPENRFYLSGFDGSYGFLLITEQAAILGTDFRYTEQAAAQAPDLQVFRIIGETADWFPEMLAQANAGRLGFEAESVTFVFYHQMTDALVRAKSQVRLVPVEGLVENLRAVKEPGELELISRATVITDAAFGHVKAIMKAGMSELELAWEIEKFMRENGSQPTPFDLIVASGPNAALAHHKPSERAIQAGEPIVIDIGARVAGYSSDMTRTFCIGQEDEKFRKIYDTVLGAQLAVLAIIKEGMTGGEADGVARAFIEEAGYGEAFGHGLGHGVGLAVHEMPRLGAKSTDRLVSGMVFTIEPGIYLTGWGGVRIEDMVILEDGKARVMSQAGKVLD